MSIRFTEGDTLRGHYELDYSKAKPNRFAARLTQESLMVVIEPELATIFPTSEAVNQALRVLAAAAQNLPTEKPKRQRKSRATATMQAGAAQ